MRNFGLKIAAYLPGDDDNDDDDDDAADVAVDDNASSLFLFSESIKLPRRLTGCFAARIL